MSLQRTVLLIVGLLAAQAAVLFLFGQPVICACGYVELWHGQVLSAGNSQHLADWYTFSHVIHGIIFFYALGYFFPRLSASTRLLLALGIEVGWELFENTPWMIEHYRQQALAQGYVGDSIVNSISDSVAMLLGFWAASRWKASLVIALAVGLELFTLYMIRDNLTLNVVNSLYPFDFISSWQAAAGIN